MGHYEDAALRLIAKHNREMMAAQIVISVLYSLVPRYFGSHAARVARTEFAVDLLMLQYLVVGYFLLPGFLYLTAGMLDVFASLLTRGRGQDE